MSNLEQDDSIEASSKLPLSRQGWLGEEWRLILDLVTTVTSILALFINFNLPDWSVLFLAVVAPIAAYDAARRIAPWLRNQTKPRFPRGKIFRGLYASQDVAAGGNFFTRAKEVEQLKKLVLGPNADRRILAITGASGAGKSVLVSLFVQEMLKSNPTPISVSLERFNSADEALTVLKRLREEVTASASQLKVGESEQDEQDKVQVVLILDQFEVCLDRLIDSYLAASKTKKSVKEVLAEAPGHPSRIVQAVGELLPLVREYLSLRILVVLRSDRYYDLRILGKLGQIPYDAFEVMGISEGSGMSSLEEMLAKLNFDDADLPRVLDLLRDPDGTILPVKAQLIGCMLEQQSFYLKLSWITRLLKKGRQRLPSPRYRWTFERFKREERGGGLIEKYFRQVIESSPREDIAPELLFVMGIEGRVKTRYTLEDLATITFRDQNEIYSTLSHLAKGGLISDTLGEFAFSHDYLAQQYNVLSGRLIDPVVRDNLAYSHTTFTERHKRALVDSDQGYADRQKTVYILRAIKFGLFLFFGFRLAQFNRFPFGRVHQLMKSAFAPYSVNSQWVLDWHYLPIAILQCCWALYVIDLVSGVFLHVDNKPAMRWSSYSLVVMVLVGMCWTAIAPGAWLICLGLNGFLVGLKFWFMGREIARCTSGRNRYGVIGLYTIINCIFVIYVGAIIYPYLSWDLPKHQGLGVIELTISLLTFSPAVEYLYVYYAVIPLLVYFVYMYRAHVRPSRAVEFIGLYKRVEAVQWRE
jgi:conflict system STAND superfamily ATPase